MDWVALVTSLLPEGISIFGERLGSGDGERKTLLTRQIAFEPLPASVLFALGWSVAVAVHGSLQLELHCNRSGILKLLKLGSVVLAEKGFNDSVLGKGDPSVVVSTLADS